MFTVDEIGKITELWRIMITIKHLLVLADAYRVAKDDLEEVTLSYRVFGDSKKLSALRNAEADITVGRFNAAIVWFSENWPADAEWPTDVIDRPPPPAADLGSQPGPAFSEAAI